METNKSIVQPLFLTQQKRNFIIGNQHYSVILRSNLPIVDSAVLQSMPTGRARDAILFCKKFARHFPTDSSYTFVHSHAWLKYLNWDWKLEQDVILSSTGSKPDDGLH